MKKVHHALILSVSLWMAASSSVLAQPSSFSQSQPYKDSAEDQQIARKCLAGQQHWSMVKCVALEKGNIEGAKQAEASADRGQAVYFRNCYICHGQHGQGNGPGAKFAHRPADLTSPEVQKLT